jgi:hypothetical protein
LRTPSRIDLTYVYRWEILRVKGFAVFVESGPLASGGAYGYIVFGVFFLWVLVASMLLVQWVGRPAG